MNIKPLGLVLIGVVVLAGTATMVVFRDTQAEAAGLQPIADYQPSAYPFEKPDWMPAPLEPVANPTTSEKVELGRHLFFDTRLSKSETHSCATCHDQKLAFTDALEASPGVTGDLTHRNSMTLANVGYSSTLTWANPLMLSLEQQALVPLLGQDPVEMGMSGADELMIERLNSDPIYPPLFKAAFPEVKGEISFATVTRALAAFQRTLISASSPYDRYRYEGDFNAVSDAVIRGEALFFSEKFECHHCHNGINFNDTVFHERDPNGQRAFHNTGLYNLDANGAYPARDTGVMDITGREDDMGRFKAPSLRNIALTAPYMHDGLMATLADVLDHYAAGGRTISDGPDAGIGRDNPLKSSFVPGFEMTDQERADMIAFLNSLTDEDFLTNPAYANPWIQKETN